MKLVFDTSRPLSDEERATLAARAKRYGTTPEAYLEGLAAAYQETEGRNCGDVFIARDRFLPSPPPRS